MVIPYFKQVCLALLSLLISFSASAEIFKWVDENGQTHYSQSPPESGEAETIDVPPPPPIAPESDNNEVDALIEKQQADEQAELEAQEKAEQEAEREAQLATNCQVATDNLRGYQNNPGRRVIDEDGNAARLSEEERQQKIQELQDKIDLYCP